MMPAGVGSAAIKGDTRGDKEIRIMAQAMTNELKTNAHKGDWSELDGGEGIHELIYHAVKLALAARGGHRAAVLEYAADVANHAMFVADACGSLDPALLTDEHVEYLNEDSNPLDLKRWKRTTRSWVKQILPSVEWEALRGEAE